MLQTLVTAFGVTLGIVLGMMLAIFIVAVVKAAMRGVMLGYIRARKKERQGHIDIPEVAAVLEDWVRMGWRPIRILAIRESGDAKLFTWNREGNTYTEEDTHEVVLRTK